MKEHIRSYYLAKEQAAHAKMKKLEHSMKMLSIYRVSSFILFFGILVFGAYRGINSLFLLAFPFFVVFLILIRRFVRKQDDFRFALAKLNVYRDELLALENSYDHYPSGDEHMDHDHPYGADLDLFGRGSIFQYLNRTTGVFGSDKLAELMSKTNINADKVRERQQAVQELAGKRDWSENYYASGRLTPSSMDEKKEIVEWLNTPYQAYSGVFYTTMLKTLPVFSVALLVLSLMDRIPYSLFFLFLLIPLTVVGSKLKAMNQEYQMMSKFKDTLSKYYRLVTKIEQENWESDLLKAESQRLNKDYLSASLSFLELRKISEALDNRSNFVGAIVLNGILLWDVKYAMKLKKWKEENAKFVPDWFEVIGLFEAINSLSFLKFNRSDLRFPELSEDKEMIIDAKEMGHLLLEPESRVNNNFDLKLPRRFVILTGANMAGKSTFLRALGSNMILAAAGAPVCAKEMTWRPLPLFSSMRTSDSLQSNESYFYAELKRLKQLLDTSDKEKELFIILDEILKGTNSKDKAEGSAMFVKKILSKSIHGIIATHDLSLCDLESEFKSEVANMSFDVSIQNDELHFDYKLREGVCQNMNATFLLNKMGLVN